MSGTDKGADEALPLGPSRDLEASSDMDLIVELSDRIGPRPPCSRQEQEAAGSIGSRLSEIGLEPRVDEFASQRSFGPTYLIIFGLALLSGLGGRGARGAGALSGVAAAALGIAESRFARRSPLRLIRRRRSQNVWARIGPPAGSSVLRGEGDSDVPETETDRTIALVSHMDSSRSGLMFHPKVTPRLGLLSTAVGAALALNAIAPLLGRLSFVRLIVGGARLFIGAATFLMLERELMGRDVPGANDNASGVAACVTMARHFSQNPLGRSELVVLVTGSEESGVVGMQDFLDRHDTDGWLFINFDGVSADAPLRVLSRENGPGGPRADQSLLDAAEAVGKESPALEARQLLDGSGLPYDSTPVLLRGGRAMSVVNQEGAIPNYHWPTDTADQVSTEAFERAVRFGAALVRTLDEGT